MVTENTLAQAIRDELRNQDRPVTWLARESGITYPKLQNRLRGDSEFTIGDVFRIASALNISADHLASEAFTSMSDKKQAA